MTHLRFSGAIVLMLACAGLVERASAAIDFEFLPNGAPTVDDQLITTEYQSAFGVAFELLEAPGAGPRIAKVGPPRTAFEGDSTSRTACGIASLERDDMPNAAAQVGCSFLTDDGILNNESFTLRVRYTTPVNAAHGVLLDVDGAELWTITARREDESVVYQIQVSPPGPDGAASVWAFPQGPSYFSIIDLVQTGSSEGVGLAFDNFSPSGEQTGIPSTEPVTHGIAFTQLPSPNPFRDSTRFTLGLSSQGPIDAAVYDVEGRRIATLLDVDLGASHYQLQWDGFDQAGHPMPSGFYVIRVAGSQTIAEKVQLIR